MIDLQPTLAFIQLQKGRIKEYTRHAPLYYRVIDKPWKIDSNIAAVEEFARIE